LTTGWYISGIAHAGLLVVLLVGGLFARERVAEVSVADVSVISEAEYAALVLREPEPEVDADVTAPIAPEADTATPDIPETDRAPEVQPPDVTDAPDSPEPVPETPEDIVVPQAEVTTNVPAVVAPPTLEDGDQIAPQATPAPAPRVAPDPSPMPEPEAESAPEVVEETAPVAEPEAETVVEETDSAAPEAATTEIVTEAETPEEVAPTESIRPRSRPPRPVRQAEKQEPAETPAPREDAVEDAVAAALAEQTKPAPPVASGPPLTSGEKDALRVAVQQCWNVGSLSTDALRTTVVVAVSMAQDGKPNTGSIRMVSFEGGTEGAARQAYEAARRAIIRCGASGFDLPVEKYDQWRDIEMTFNPERMRIK
jgi:hypothetical protein